MSATTRESRLRDLRSKYTEYGWLLNREEGELLEIAERLWRALRFAGTFVDGIGDTDLHELAYAVSVERTGKDEGQDATDDDYAEAFVRAALAEGGKHEG